MKDREGFTLVELMVVVLIVGILAAVALPLMSGRINSAKWTEANAACGTIATAIRAYSAQTGPGAAIPTGALATSATATTATGTALGINAADLQGTYFGATSYSITSAASDATTGAVTYMIHVAPVVGNAGGTVFTTATKDFKQNGTFQ
jgi:prepilin-type N-terminal cleavage/methylation domain-containing protein